MPLEVGDCFVTWGDLNSIIAKLVKENDSNKIQEITFGHRVNQSRAELQLKVKMRKSTILWIDLELTNGRAGSHKHPTPVQVRLKQYSMANASVGMGLGNALGVVRKRVKKLIHKAILAAFTSFLRQADNKSFFCRDLVLNVNATGKARSYWAEGVVSDQNGIYFKVCSDCRPDIRIGHLLAGPRESSNKLTFNGPDRYRFTPGPVALANCSAKYYDINKLLENRLQTINKGKSDTIQKLEFRPKRGTDIDVVNIHAKIDHQELFLSVKLIPGNNTSSWPIGIKVLEHQMFNAGLKFGIGNLIGVFRDQVEHQISKAIRGVFQDFLRQVGRIPFQLKTMVADAHFGADNAWFWAENICFDGSGIKFRAVSRHVLHVRVLSTKPS